MGGWRNSKNESNDIRTQDDVVLERENLYKFVFVSRRYRPEEAIEGFRDDGNFNFYYYLNLAITSPGGGDVRSDRIGKRNRNVVVRASKQTITV